MCFAIKIDTKQNLTHNKKYVKNIHNLQWAHSAIGTVQPYFCIHEAERFFATFA